MTVRSDLLMIHKLSIEAVVKFHQSLKSHHSCRLRVLLLVHLMFEWQTFIEPGKNIHQKKELYLQSKRINIIISLPRLACQRVVHGEKAKKYLMNMFFMSR